MNSEDVELAAKEEYHIEVSGNRKLRLMVTAGIAEVRGQELLSDKWYVFSNISISISTFTGARLRIDGMCELRYVTRAPMTYEIFKYFDRIKAMYENDENNKITRIMVLGCGRTTFSITLANYFIRTHNKVIFTEIDPSKGNIFPGTIGSTFVESIIEYSEGFKLNNPQCLYYGSTCLENMDLFDLQVDTLHKITRSRDEYFQIILGPTLDSAVLNNLIKRMEIAEVVFVGDERLYNKMELVVNKVFIENNGYIKGNNDVSASINRYFNGPNGEYTPCTLILKQDWKIVRIGEEHAAPESALPLGGTRHVGKSSVNSAELSDNCIMAISEAETEEEVSTAPVVGFVACLDEKKSRILCTQSRLPKGRFLIKGNVRYLEY
ncbi:polyribonucleotide 5'-hydroxyl-kinase [Pancytospora epiphaga]|nr:polyribonucleotide 5'-hydroxyl-kinase [Pancytospora epiphaga]